MLTFHIISNKMAGRKFSSVPERVKIFIVFEKSIFQNKCFAKMNL